MAAFVLQRNCWVVTETSKPEVIFTAGKFANFSFWLFQWEFPWVFKILLSLRCSFLAFAFFCLFVWCVFNLPEPPLSLYVHCSLFVEDPGHLTCNFLQSGLWNCIILVQLGMFLCLLYFQQMDSSRQRLDQTWVWSLLQDAWQQCVHSSGRLFFYDGT